MNQPNLPGVDRIVRKPDTGERFISTPILLWTERLNAWRTAIIAAKARLERDPVLRCSYAPTLSYPNDPTRRGRWDLYHAAKRAMYDTIPPCPIPEGHCMFSNPSDYNCVEV